MANYADNFGAWSSGQTTSNPNIWKAAAEGTLPELDFGQKKSESGNKGWNYGDWSQKNPKTAGFLKGFMQARGMGTPGGGGAKKGGGIIGAFGTPGSSKEVAEGVSESRDPFFMQTIEGEYIPGKKGFGRVAAEAGLGALGGFVTGGPMGAVGGTLGSFSQNLDQF